MIYLLRHGLDDENYVGGYSDVSLTDEGFKQLDKVIPYIKRLNINKIYSSDIKRAIQTANYINKEINVPIVIDKKFRELDKGNLNGKLKTTLTFEEFNNLNTKDIKEKIGNGESMIDLYKRVKYLYETNYFNDLNNSLIVTHRGFINMLYYLLQNIDLSVDKARFNVTHSSIHELNINKQKIRKIF